MSKHLKKITILIIMTYANFFLIYQNNTGVVDPALKFKGANIELFTTIPELDNKLHH